MKYMGCVDKMSSKKEIKEFNAKIETIKNNIKDILPNGCKGISCDHAKCSKCILYNEMANDEWFFLCELLMRRANK